MFIRLLSAAVAVALSGAAAVAQTAPPPPPAAESADGVEVLFAPQATGMTFDGKTLTLDGVSPAITFFADRPHRVAGHLTAAQFADVWNATADSFKNDPPNAALSILGAKDESPAVVELTSLAVSGDKMTFGVRVLEGTLPEKAGAVSLFIDPWVWMPGRWGWGPPPRPVYPAPFVTCHYSWYLGHRVCRGYW